MNISGLLYETSRHFKTKAAIIEDAQSVSYDELWSIVERLSGGISAIGVKKGGRVALILPNSKEFVFSFFALLRRGIIVAPLSINLTAFEFKRCIDNLEPHALISVPAFINKIFEAFPLLLHNKILIYSGGGRRTDTIMKSHDIRDLLDLGEECGVEGVDNDGTDIASINYTYRGYGYPLGAQLSHENYYEGVRTYVDSTKMADCHTVLSLLPLNHIYPLVGCMLAPLICGATIIISRNYLPRSIFRLVEDYGINYLTIVPSLYTLLMKYYDKNEFTLRSLSCCITGGAYMRPDLQEAIMANMNLKVLQGYGLTECFILTWNNNEGNKIGTLGLPFASNISIKIVDDEGIDLGRCHIGEVVVKSPAIMQGYYNHPEETLNVMKDGWFYTGDWGYVDEAGYLHFEGVKKRIAKVGGSMVDLREVEEVILSHPLVVAASVTVQEDAMWGHSVSAKIEKRNEDLTVGELQAFCKARLAHYKVPVALEFVPGVCRP